MCDVSGPAQTRLPNDATAPGLARSFLRDAACDVHHAEVLDEAQLLVSELVTNAVLHGAPPITVRVECDGARLLVSVTDGSSDPAQLRDAGPDAVSGRGIRLVDFISDQWGVQPAEPGKDVWFTLRS